MIYLFISGLFLGFVFVCVFIFGSPFIFAVDMSADH